MKRSVDSEMMDDPQIRPEDLRSSLRFMSRVNGLLGGHRVVLDYFDRQPLPDSFSVLDIGCGAGDIPFALARWASARGKRADITAIDTQPLCLAYASQNFPSPHIGYLERSAFEIEKLGPFDFIISSMFFHHLSDDEIVRLLQMMDRTARRGWIVNDLYRGALNYAGAWFLGALSLRRVIFNDAKLSVKRAFVPRDFERYARRAGLKEFRVERRPVFRVALSGHGTH